MTIHVHIDRLVLDGFSLEQRDGAFVHAEVERELTRLLGKADLATQLRSSRIDPQAQTAELPLPKQIRPTALGQQVARCIYNGIGAMK